MSVKDRGRPRADIIPTSVRVTGVPYKCATPRQTLPVHPLMTFRQLGVQGAESEGLRDAQDLVRSSMRPPALAAKAWLFQALLASAISSQRSTRRIPGCLPRRHELW